jgi:hypothetical protein
MRTAWGWRAWLAAALVAGCGATAKPTAAPTQEPDIDPDEAVTHAKGLVTEVYESIGHGDTDSLMTLLSEKLVVFGPRRGDALASRQDTIVALGKVVDANNKRPVMSAGVAVMAGPGGHSAVAVDAIDTGGHAMSVLAVLSNSDDMWLVGAASVADAPSAAMLKKELARDAVVPPAMTSSAAVADAAKPVVEQWRRGLAAQAEWGADLTTVANGVFVGPDAGDVARGKRELKKLWKARVDAGVREVVVGDVTAQTTADGRMVWLSAPVVRKTGAESLPLRVFAVYALRGDAWKLCALQEAVAIEGPGAGAKFRKMMPASPAEPAPAAPAKKMKKKPVEDDGGAVADDAPVAKPAKAKPRPKPVASDDGDDDDAKPVAKPAQPAKKKVKKPAADDDATATADDDAPKPKPKKKAKPKPADDDDDNVAVADDDAPKPKPKKVAKKKPASDDDDDGN